MIFEMMGHSASPRYSAFQKELSALLYRGGLPETVRHVLFELGIGVHISKTPDIVSKAIVKGNDQVASATNDGNVGGMFIADDFMVMRRGGAPLFNGKMSAALSVANVLWKDLTDSHMDLRVTAIGEGLYPSSFATENALGFVSRCAEEKAQLYGGVRRPEIGRRSAVLKPYGGIVDSGNEDGIPRSVDMRRVKLLQCVDNGFKKDSDIESLLFDVIVRLKPHLEKGYVFATGDWHMYHVMQRVIRRHPFECRHVILVPGAFHIALNAQEALFMWFAPLLEPLYQSVFPGKLLRKVKRPLERKYILDLVLRGWMTVRDECLVMVSNGTTWPAELQVLLTLLDEYIPVSLDLYATFQAGDYDAYERILYRALFLFAQLGKHHYVSCVVEYMATVDF